MLLEELAAKYLVIETGCRPVFHPLGKHTDHLLRVVPDLGTEVGPVDSACIPRSVDPDTPFEASSSDSEDTRSYNPLSSE